MLRLKVTAALQGAGKALVPSLMGTREMQSGALLRPFETEVDTGGNGVIRTGSRSERDEPAAVQLFQDWIGSQSAAGTRPSGQNVERTTTHR